MESAFGIDHGEIAKGFFRARKPSVPGMGAAKRDLDDPFGSAYPSKAVKRRKLNPGHLPPEQRPQFRSIARENAEERRLAQRATRPRKDWY